MAAGLPVLGLGAFLDTLSRATDAGRTPFTGANNAANAVLREFQQEEKRVFSTEGGAQGRQWAPLAASTLKRRLPGPILQQSRRLKGSLVRQTPGDSHVRVTGRAIEMGSQVPYAQYHQKGTPHMPARPPILATGQLAQKLARAVFVSLQRRIG